MAPRKLPFCRLVPIIDFFKKNVLCFLVGYLGGYTYLRLHLLTKGMESACLVQVVTESRISLSGMHGFRIR
jgi:hypothetical protein